MLIWGDLITWPSYSGLFRYDTAERAWYYQVEQSEIEQALELFERDGKIQRFSEHAFVKEFFSYQRFAPSGRRAAELELESLAARTDLASVAARELGLCRESIGALQESCKDSAERISYHIKSYNIISNQPSFGGRLD